MGTKVIVTGPKGRMGQSILNCAKQDPGIVLVGTLDKKKDAQQCFRSDIVVIDFTVHHATPALAEMAAKAFCPMVIGTTGFNHVELAAITNASKSIPIVLAPNMSVGVNLLFKLVRVASAILKEFDVEIIEKHHRRKKDSPSGTAMRLAEILADSKKSSVSKLAKHGRVGDVGERTAHEIGIHSVRGGDYVGDHTIIFAGDGETVELTHHASSRDLFARGALLAAKWVSSKKPGLYDMEDVLGLRV